MDNFILPDLTPDARARILADNAEGIEEKTFIRPMEGNELNNERINLQQVVDNIERLEEEAKAVKKQYSEQIKALIAQRRASLRALKQGGIETTEATYKMIDRDENTAAYYSKYGHCIYQRPLLPEEKQMAMRLSAANE